MGLKELWGSVGVYNTGTTAGTLCTPSCSRKCMKGFQVPSISEYCAKVVQCLVGLRHLTWLEAYRGKIGIPMGLRSISGSFVAEQALRRSSSSMQSYFWTGESANQFEMRRFVVKEPGRPFSDKGLQRRRGLATTLHRRQQT